MSGPATGGAERRRDPRAPISTEVRIRYPSLGQLAREICRDVSVGGMFVQSPVPPEIGTPVEFELELPAKRPLVVRGAGRVVWRRTADGSAPSGFGVEFQELDPRFRELVFRVVDRFIQRGGNPFDLDLEA